MFWWDVFVSGAWRSCYISLCVAYMRLYATKRLLVSMVNMQVITWFPIWREWRKCSLYLSERNGKLNYHTCHTIEQWNLLSCNNSLNTSRRTSSAFQTPRGVENTRRSRVFFLTNFWGVVKSGSVWTYFSNKLIFCEKIEEKVGLIYVIYWFPLYSLYELLMIWEYLFITPLLYRDISS